MADRGQVRHRQQGRVAGELLGDLGYTIEPLKPAGYLAKAGGRPAVVVHPHANAFLFARLDEQGRLPEGALIASCRAHGTDYGVLAAGTRLRLLAAGPAEAGASTRYLELDAAALEPEMRPLLGLLSPAYLLDGGFREVLGEARLRPGSAPEVGSRPAPRRDARART